MKKSLINDYLKALKTLVNDNHVSFAITENFADKCHIVAYWCGGQVLHNFTLFNDSSTVNYDNLINDYLAIMAKHPIEQGEKQLFSLRYDTVGYCSLAVTDSSNLELYGTTHKRISRKLAKVLHNYANYEADDDYISCYTDNYISCYTDRYITSHNYSQSLMFKL